MSKSLNEICDHLMEIEEGLMYGQINFHYDALMSAMKPGHPAMILDSIMAPVFLPTLYGNDVEIDKVIKLHDDLSDFMGSVKVKELRQVIKELKTFIKCNSENEVFHDAEPQMTLKDIRKKYIGKKIDLSNLSGDVWNRENKNGNISFHFYFNNWDEERGATGTFMDHVDMSCDDSNTVTYIAPLYCEKQTSASFRRSTFEPCRATKMHYEEFDNVLSTAFERNYE